nr:CMT1A duplicated region transcript 15 protein-like protein isoform X1 [Macaca nemestrina]XP_024652186.1 CMT1A duplicated region transcript 15 protein-like protein isoform X1 [Macaca nemestrina]
MGDRFPFFSSCAMCRERRTSSARCGARAHGTGRAPLETALQLEAAAPEPSGLCTGTAKDQPSEELPDLRPPAVATGLSPGADSVAGDRERVASTTLDSSSHTAPSPGHGGSHGVRDQGMQPRLIYLTGKRLILFTRATSQVQQDLCILPVLGVSICAQEVLESRNRSLQERVPAAPPAPRVSLVFYESRKRSL